MLFVELTAEVVKAKLALVCPAGMVTVAGTDALAELDDSVTEIPPVGAGPLRLAVTVLVVPPVMVVEPVVVRPMKFGAETINP